MYRHLSTILALGLTALLPTASASDFPNQPIRLVVPYAAGGSTDLISRTVARLLEAEMGNPVIVENRPGANTIVAAGHVAGSRPDGHTLLIGGTASTNINHLLYQKLPYDIEKDFVPVGGISRMPYAVLVNPGLGVQSVQELAALARGSDQLNYGTAGNGNPMHMAALMFQGQTGARMVQIPYQGSAPALTALMAGEVQASFDVLGTALPHVRSGKLRLLAVTTRERVPQTAETPTMLESGFKDYVVETGFVALAPTATPEATRQVLNRAFNAVLQSPEYHAALEQQTLVAYPPLSIEALGEDLRNERKQWGNVIQQHQIRLD